MLFYVVDFRFARWQQGFYGRSVYNYRHWSAFLSHFDQIVVFGRCYDTDDQPLPESRADGVGVSFWCVPDFRGPLDAVKKVRRLNREVSKLLGKPGAIVLKAPGLVTNLVASRLQLRGRPYCVQVIGDPIDSLNRRALGTLKGLAYAPIGALALRQVCRRAFARTYVTETTLQQRYEPKLAGARTNSFTDGEIEDGQFDLPRKTRPQTGTLKLIFVGSLAQRYKGGAELLRALGLCIQAGLLLTLDIAGDGIYRHELEELADRLGISSSVRFLGYIPQRDSIMKRLMAADIFVMPSHSEGLPKALVEAMSCGLPCVCTDAGGISELLPGDELVPVGDVKALAAQITKVATHWRLRKSMSERNISKARHYSSSEVAPRRHQFLSWALESSSGSNR